MVKDRDERPPKGPHGGALLLCMQRGDALFGVNLGVSRSVNLKKYCLSCLIL